MDARLIISGTFAIIALAWVATNGQQLGAFTSSLAGSYGQAVKALRP